MFLQLLYEIQMAPGLSELTQKLHFRLYNRETTALQSGGIGKRAHVSLGARSQPMALFATFSCIKTSGVRYRIFDALFIETAEVNERNRGEKREA